MWISCPYPKIGPSSQSFMIANCFEAYLSLKDLTSPSFMLNRKDSHLSSVWQVMYWSYSQGQGVKPPNMWWVVVTANNIVCFFPLQALWKAAALNRCYEARQAKVTLVMLFPVRLVMLLRRREASSLGFSVFLSGEVRASVVRNILSVVFPQVLVRSYGLSPWLTQPPISVVINKYMITYLFHQSNDSHAASYHHGKSSLKHHHITLKTSYRHSLVTYRQHMEPTSIISSTGRSELINAGELAINYHFNNQIYWIVRSLTSIIYTLCSRPPSTKGYYPSPLQEKQE